MVTLLLRHGADPRAKDAAEQTPADLAKEVGDEAVLKALGAGAPKK
jgi:hypothetical protein